MVEDGGTMARLKLLVPTHLVSRNVLQPLGFSFLWACLVALWLDQGILPEWLQPSAERTLTGLGSVTGLLLAFRSNSATSRWESASKAWGSTIAASRSLLRLLSTSLYQSLGEESHGEATLKVQSRIDDFLRLIPCFSFALMLQLQGQPVDATVEQTQGNTDSIKATTAVTATQSEALSATTLLALLPLSYTQSLNLRKTSTDSTTVKSSRQLRPSLTVHLSSSSATNTGSTTPSSDRKSAAKQVHISEAERELKLSQNIDASKELLRKAKPRTDHDGHVIPQELAMDLLRALQAELNQFHEGVTSSPSAIEAIERKSIDAPNINEPQHHLKLSGPIFAHSSGLLNTLEAQLTELERLRDTPMPALVSSHLRFLLHVQLVLLPLAFSAHVPLPWLPLPCLLVAATTFGLHAISERLALPFGEEREKLPMRRYVAGMVRDWRETAGRAEDIFESQSQERRKVQSGEVLSGQHLRQTSDGMLSNSQGTAPKSEKSVDQTPQEGDFDGLSEHGTDDE